jgi:hypothetical protein
MTEIGPMPAALKDAAKAALNPRPGDYNMFVKVAKDLKEGKETRESANGKIRILLKQRQDLIDLFSAWSSPAAAQTGGIPVAAASPAAPAPAPALGGFGALGGLGAKPAGAFGAAPGFAFCGGFGAAAGVGPPGAPPAASSGASGPGMGSAPAFASAQGASGAAASVRSGPASFGSTAAKPVAASGPAFASAASFGTLAIASGPGMGKGMGNFPALSAKRSQPPDAQISPIVGPSGNAELKGVAIRLVPPGGSLPAGGKGQQSDRDEGGRYHPDRHGPLKDERLGELTSKLKNLNPPSTSALVEGTTKAQQEEWLRWLRDVEFGPQGFWRVKQVHA